MNEIDIINNLRKVIVNKNALNLKDDVFFDNKKQLLASIDTYNENIHYINFKYPHLIIKKVIRASISDIICKGVDPKYLLISFSGNKKQLSKKNIKLIIQSIKQEQIKYKFSLVGGDTTSSNKSSFSVCVIGFSKKIIKRNTSYIKDDIYLTGNIADASVGLYILKKNINLKKIFKNYFIDKYFKPDLPYGFHRELFKFASSSMDVSDGLLVDLKKLINNKNKGFIINLEYLPKSFYFNELVKGKKISIYNHLFQGDDYQILFTSNKRNRKSIKKYAKKWNQKITKIGSVIKGNQNYLKNNNKLNKINDYQGYIHNF